MSSQITRREMAAVLGSATGMVVLRAQDSQASQPEDLNAAREQNRKYREAMAKVDLPVSIEPAFQFKA